MAKYNSSPFGNISGEVLGVVASSNKGVKFLRNKGKTADAKTAKQLARRAIYGEFCTLWDEKILGGSEFDYKRMGLKKNTFQDVLSFTLKFSENASLLWLTMCPTKGTMSAPVFKKTGFNSLSNESISVDGFFFIPTFSKAGEYEFFSAFFGQSLYDYSSAKVALEAYSHGNISVREWAFSARVPNTTQNLLLGQKVFRSYWYVNKQTGQVSKPMCIACDESGNAEIFYPFGK